MDIQAAIDAIDVWGGVINIPPGVHPGEGANLGQALRLKSNIILQGSGVNTVIPPIARSPVRLEGISLRDLTIDPALKTGPLGPALDFVNVSASYCLNVRTTPNSTYGLMMAYASLYNTFVCCFFNASIIAVELYNVANSNTFVGCKYSAPQGLNVIGSNGNAFVGGALETDQPNMVYKVISGDDGATFALGVRQEDGTPNHSSTYWNQ